MSKEIPQEILSEAEWIWIKPHVLRDVVIIVESSLDILRVGSEIASNNMNQVDEWIKKGALAKPSLEQVKSWDESPTKRFLSIIVQPYVLIQEIKKTDLH